MFLESWDGGQKNYINEGRLWGITWYHTCAYLQPGFRVRTFEKNQIQEGVILSVYKSGCVEVLDDSGKSFVSHNRERPAESMSIICFFF